MSVKAGRIVINLTASTSQYVADMDAAIRKNAEVGSSASQMGARLNEIGGYAGQTGRAFADTGVHGVTGVQATSGALRVLEGNIANNLRAGERFVANTLGLGPAMQKIFPLVGGIALLGIFEHLIGKGKEFHDAFQKMQDQPTKIAEGFRAINAPLQKSNDELSVANHKLQNEINKLQGKPQNGLKLALDEAIVSSDNLAESLNHTLGEVEKLLKENERAFMGWAFGKADTGPIEESQKTLRKQLGDITDATDEQLASLGEKAEATNNLPKKERLKALKDLSRQGDVIHTKERTDAEKVLRAEPENVNDDLRERKRLQEDSSRPAPVSTKLQANASEIPLDPATLAAYRREFGEAWVQRNVKDGKIDFGPTKSLAIQPTPANIPEEDAAIKDQEGRRKYILKQLANISRTALNEKLVGEKGGLEAKTKYEDPFGNELEKLDAELRGVNAELDAAGKSESGKVLAKSWAESTEGDRRDE